MHKETAAEPFENNEITVIDVIKLVKKLLSRVWIVRKYLVIIAFIAGVLGFTRAHFKKNLLFTSHLTFAVEEKSSSGGLSGLAGQIGIDLGGGGAGLFSSENLMLILKSKRIIHQSLLTPIPELQDKTLFNLYLAKYYSEQLKTGKVKFIHAGKQMTDYSRLEDSLLNVVGLAVKGKITLVKLDKKASIIDVSVVGEDEAWTFYFNKMLIKQAAELYQNIKVGKSRGTVEALSTRVDSIKKVLDNAMSSAARESDRSQALILNESRVLNTGNKRFDYRLMEGDRLVVPEAIPYVSIQGPGVQYLNNTGLEAVNAPYKPSQRANKYIQEYGDGFSDNASKKRVFVIAADDKVSRTKNFYLFKVYPKVSSGATVYVGLKDASKEKRERGEPVDWNRVIEGTTIKITGLATLVILLRQLD